MMIPCRRCGIEVHRTKSQLSRRKTVYCSYACHSASRRVVDARWRDPKQIAEYMRAYVAANREKHNRQNRKWVEANREKHNALQRARRAAGNAADFTGQDWLELKRRAGFSCLKCGQRESLLVRLEPDHVVPIARGGLHHKDNIQPLCRYCNASKGAKHIDYRQAKAS